MSTVLLLGVEKMNDKIELYIYNNAQKKMYSPILKDKITWTTERKGVAGKDAVSEGSRCGRTAGENRSICLIL